MIEHGTARLRTRSRAAGVGVLLIGVVLAMFSAVTSVSPASAAEIDGVTSVDIVDPPPYVKDQTYQLDATWAVPDTAEPGDTFTLDFPDALVAFEASFPLEDGDGNEIGTCEVTNAQFVCTLGDFVLTHDNVNGSLDFTAKFTEAFEDEEITFETGNGVTIVTDVEGGVADVDPSLPQSPVKFGYMNNDGTSMTWVVQVPSEDLGAGPDPVVTDDYDAPLVFDPAGLTVRSIANDDWNDRDDPAAWTYLGAGTGAGSYTLTDRPADTAFDVQLNDAVTDGTRLYEISVIMALPADVENGDLFENSAVVNGTTYTAEPVEYVGAGGGGEGDLQPSIDIEKWSTVDGYPAGDFDSAPGKAVDVDTPVDVTFTITNDGDEALVDVTVGDTTDAGADITGLSCDFSALGGPATGTTWAGPFDVDDSFECTGTVPGMSVGETHSDTAGVVGTGIGSERVVDDSDPFHVTTPEPEPAIGIVKGDAAGNAADTADDAVTLADGAATLVFTVTNAGTEPLIDVVVYDRVIEGGVVEGLTCTFPDGSTGTEWAGPFAVGDAFDCSASLSGVAAGGDHEDVATAMGTGAVSGTTVDDENPYFAMRPAAGALAVTGTDGASSIAGIALGLLLLGASVFALGRRRASRVPADRI